MANLPPLNWDEEEDKSTPPAKTEGAVLPPLNWDDEEKEDVRAVAPVDINDPEASVKKSGIGQAVLQGAGQGITMNLGDEMTGVAGALWNPENNDKSLVENYVLSRDYARKKRDESLKDHPNFYRAAEVGGGIMSGVGLGAAGKTADIVSKAAAGTPLMRGADAVSKGTRLLAPELKFESFLKEAPGLAKSMATSGAITSAGASDKGMIDDPIGLGGDTLKGAAVSTLLGTPLAYGGGKIIDTVGEGVARGTAKVMGRGKDVVDPYLANPEKYNDPALTFENVQEMIDAPLRKASKDLSGATDAATKAAERAKIARGEYVQGLRDTNVAGDLPDLVDKGLIQHRGRVGELANDQMEMLAPVEGKVDLSSLDNVFNKGLDRERIAGVHVTGDQDVAAINQARGLVDDVRPKGVTKTESKYDPVNMKWNEESTTTNPKLELSPVDAVKLRQKMKDVLSYDAKTGSYNPRGNRVGQQAYGEINKGLDTQLPNSTEYAALRGQLADESQFGEKASELFGHDEKLPVLSSLADPKNAEKLAVLEQLDKKYNLGIMDRLKPYMDARKTLSNPMELEQRVAGLPQSQAAKQADDALAHTKSSQEGFEGLTPENSQATMRKLMFANAKKPEVRANEMMDSLGEYAGQDLTGKVGDFKVKSAFGGGGPNGSRLVQIARGIGGQKLGGPLGIAAGLADYSTGTIAKKALDAYLASKPANAAMWTSGVRTAIDHLTQVGADKYLGALDAAAQRGPEALAVTHAMLLKDDPEYAQLVGGAK